MFDAPGDPSRILRIVPPRLRPLPPADVAALLDDRDTGDLTTHGERDLVKHFLAVLATRYPGKSVEVRIPPYAAVQCIEGARHTRGTPPAVVETDATTWIALARGELSFGDALSDGHVRASGERSDLTSRLPLI